VYLLAYTTWSAARNRVFMTEDRLLQTLLTHPAVQGLLVANPYQSGVARAVRQIAGRLHEVPFELDRPKTALLSPYRLRRRDPTSIGGARRSFVRYGEAVRRAADGLGLSQPAVITSHPLQAAFAPLE